MNPIATRPAFLPRVFGAVIILLSACGGGEYAPPPTVARTVDGVLAGTVTRGGNTFNMLAFANAGRFMAIDAGGMFYDGTFTVTNGQATSSNLRLYNAATSRPFIKGFTESGTLSAAVNVDSGWTGNFAGPALAGTLALNYDRPAGDQDSSLGFTAGTWLFQDATYQSVLTISDSGATQTTNTDAGTPLNCDSAGSVALINPDFGTYRLQTTVSGAGCPTGFGGAYTGFILLGQSANPPSPPLSRLIAFLAKPEFFLSYVAYQRQ